MSKNQNTKARASNTYSEFGGMLAGGFDGLLIDSGNEQMVELDLIEIRPQDREEFEDDENTLADLGRSLAKRQLQSILVRHGAPGASQPFVLVAGERRVRAARLEGLTQLRARVEEMSEEEAQDAQLAENIHRKNLTQIEAAKRLQRDLDQLGSIEAVVAKHNKSRSWVSKTLTLLTLPENARRLVSENISADLETIGQVKTIEQIDPAAAKALVDDLKATRGSGSARAKVQAVKEKVKPGKAKPTNKAKAVSSSASLDEVAGTLDRSVEQPSEGKIFARAKNPANSVHDRLGEAFTRINESNHAPQSILDSMDPAALDECQSWLAVFYEAGKQAKDAARAVVQGLRKGEFASDGYGAFALAAFLYGADSSAKFSILNVLASAKD